MRIAPLALSVFAIVGLSGCDVIPSIGTGSGGSDAGAASSASPAASGGTTAATSDAGAGVDCITESLTGATICTGIASCPNVTVDHDVFPDCGFRPGSGVIDLECACQNSLCPIGVAKTCDEAAALLKDQNETTVCTQVSEGRCTGGTTTTTPAASSTCDKQCESECGGAPGCISLCGC